MSRFGNTKASDRSKRRGPPILTPPMPDPARPVLAELSFICPPLAPDQTCTAGQAPKAPGPAWSRASTSSGARRTPSSHAPSSARACAHPFGPGRGRTRSPWKRPTAGRLLRRSADRHLALTTRTLGRGNETAAVLLRYTAARRCSRGAASGQLVRNRRVTQAGIESGNRAHPMRDPRNTRTLSPGALGRGVRG